MTGPGRSATAERRSLPAFNSYLCLLGYLERVIDFDSQVAHRALQILWFVSSPLLAGPGRSQSCACRWTKRYARCAVRGRPELQWWIALALDSARTGVSRSWFSRPPWRRGRAAGAARSDHAWIDAVGKGDKGIGAAQWHPLERVEHAAADHGAHAGDLPQARVVLLARVTRLDERLDSRVDACDELVQSLPQRFKLGGKSLQSPKRLDESSPNAADLGAPFEQSVDLALLGSGRDP
jgi:hypothetical protein